MEAGWHFQHQYHGQNAYATRTIEKSSNWRAMVPILRLIQLDRSNNIPEPEISLKTGLSADQRTKIH
jgi:hypothetical protein